MNGRRARERHRGERELRDRLAAADREPLELLEDSGGAEVWRRGPVGFIVPVVREDWPAELKNAMSLRRTATLTGVCACGGRRVVESPVQVFLDHVPPCPAADEALAEMLARLERGGAS